MKRSVVLLAVALGLVLAGSVTVGAQQIFRATTDMVFLSVTVTQGSDVVGGLDADDFSVFEDGQQQDITVFSRDPQPIALSLLIDASTSMETKLGLAGDAAVGFVRRMRAGDTAQVVTFNSRTLIRQEFTSDTQQLERAIRTMRASGSTSLYTAMYIAFSELERVGRRTRGEVRRQAIVLLSDGEDTTSVLGYDEVLDRAKQSDVIVFAVGLRDDGRLQRRFRQQDFSLRSLAQTTGGRAFFVQAASDLSVVYNQIADELAAQYTIGYTPRNPSRDGEWRQIAVKVNVPGAVARTRAGYFGPTGTK